MKISMNHIKVILGFKLVLIAIVFLVIKGHLYFGSRSLSADDSKEEEETSLSSIINLPSFDSSKMSETDAKKYLELMEKKKQELLAISQNLKERQDILTNMEKTIDEKIKKLENEKTLFTDIVDKQIDLSEERKKELADFYKKMPAKKAAPIFSTMNPDYVVALFKLLPQKQVTSILSEMSSDKSKELSEYYGRVGLLDEYSAMNDLKKAIKSEFQECK